MIKSVLGLFVSTSALVAQGAHVFGDMKASLDCQEGLNFWSGKNWKVNMALDIAKPCNDISRPGFDRRAWSGVAEEFLITTDNGVEHFIELLNGPKTGHIEVDFNILTEGIENAVVIGNHSIVFTLENGGVFKYTDLYVVDNKKKELKSSLALVRQSSTQYQMKFTIFEIGEYPILIDPLGATEYPYGMPDEAQSFMGTPIADPYNNEGEEFGFRVAFGKLVGSDETMDLIVGAPHWQPSTDVSRQQPNRNPFNYLMPNTHYVGRVAAYKGNGAQFETSVTTVAPVLTSGLPTDTQVDIDGVNDCNSPKYGASFNFDGDQSTIIMAARQCGTYHIARNDASSDTPREITGYDDPASVSSDWKYLLWSPAITASGDFLVGTSGARPFIESRDTPEFLWSLSISNQNERVTANLVQDLRSSDSSFLNEPVLVRPGHYAQGHPDLGEWVVICDDMADLGYENSERGRFVGVCFTTMKAEDRNDEENFFEPRWMVFGDLLAYDGRNKGYEGRFGFQGTLGKFNNDNNLDLLIGQPGFSDNFLEGGRALLFTGTGTQGEFSQSPVHSMVGTVNGGRFGTALGNLGDINSDGLDDVAIGAPYANNNNGEIIVYLAANDGKFIYHQRIRGSEGEMFGFSIAPFATDIDGDSLPDTAVGAPGYNGTNNLQGKVYVLKGVEFTEISLAFTNPLESVPVVNAFDVTVDVTCNGPRDCTDIDLVLTIPDVSAYPLSSTNNAITNCTQTSTSAQGTVYSCAFELDVNGVNTLTIPYDLDETVQYNPIMQFSVEQETNGAILFPIAVSHEVTLTNEVTLTLSQDTEIADNTVVPENTDELQVRGNTIAYTGPIISNTNPLGTAFGVVLNIESPAGITYLRIDGASPSFTCQTIRVGAGSTPGVTRCDFGSIQKSSNIAAFASHRIIFSTTSFTQNAISLLARAFTSSNLVGDNPTTPSNVLTVRAEETVLFAVASTQRFIGCNAQPTRAAGTTTLTLPFTIQNGGNFVASGAGATIAITSGENQLESYEIKLFKVAGVETICTVNTVCQVPAGAFIDITETVFVTFVAKLIDGASGDLTVQVTASWSADPADPVPVQSTAVTSTISLCEDVLLTPFITDVTSSGRVAGTSSVYPPSASSNFVNRSITFRNFGVSNQVSAQTLTVTIGEYEEFDVLPAGWFLANPATITNNAYDPLMVSGSYSFLIGTLLKTEILSADPAVEGVTMTAQSTPALTASNTIAIFNGIDLFFSGNSIPSLTINQTQILELTVRNAAPITATGVIIEFDLGSQVAAVSTTQEGLQNIDCTSVTTEPTEDSDDPFAVTVQTCTINFNENQPVGLIKLEITTNDDAQPNTKTINARYIDSNEVDTPAIAGFRRKSVSFEFRILAFVNLGMSLRAQGSNGVVPVRNCRGCELILEGTIKNLGTLSTGVNVITMQWPANALTRLDIQNQTEQIPFCTSDPIFTDSSFSCSVAPLANSTGGTESGLSLSLTFVSKETIGIGTIFNTDFSISQDPTVTAPGSQSSVGLSIEIVDPLVDLAVVPKIGDSDILLSTVSISEMSWEVRNYGIADANDATLYLSGYQDAFDLNPADTAGCTQNSTHMICALGRIQRSGGGAVYVNFYNNFPKLKGGAEHSFTINAYVEEDFVKEVVLSNNRASTTQSVQAPVAAVQTEPASTFDITIIIIIAAASIYILINLVIMGWYANFFSRDTPPDDFMDDAPAEELDASA